MDWRQLLDRHAIPYQVDRGERNLTMQCPWCGAADEKKHDLAVSLKGRGYKCWRNMEHRGRSRTKLIHALLRVSWEQARELSGEIERPLLIEDAGVMAQLNSYLGTETRSARPTKLDYPLEFRELDRSLKARPFWNYLLDRGFNGVEVEWLAENYDLRYATRGLYKARIIVPIKNERGQLLSWTARSIHADAELRYRTLSTDSIDGRPQALVPAPHTLLGLPALWTCENPRLLVVVEGPFDALKISAVGHPFGIYGTCLFGLNASLDQADLLEELSVRFPKMKLVLDRDAALRSFAVLQLFHALPISMAQLPPGVKDPGELSRSRALEFVQRLAA